MILSEYLNRFQDIWAFPVRGGSGPPMPMTYKPFKAPWHKEQEYKWFRGGDLWILPVWGGRGGQGYPEGPWHQYYLMHLDTRKNNTYDLRIRIINILTLLRYSGTSYIRTLQFTTISFEDRFFYTYFVSFIRNTAFQILTFCFYHKTPFHYKYDIILPDGKIYWNPA